MPLRLISILEMNSHVDTSSFGYKEGPLVRGERTGSKDVNDFTSMIRPIQIDCVDAVHVASPVIRPAFLLLWDARRRT